MKFKLVRHCRFCALTDERPASVWCHYQDAPGRPMFAPYVEGVYKYEIVARFLAWWSGNGCLAGTYRWTVEESNEQQAST